MFLIRPDNVATTILFSQSPPDATRVAVYHTEGEQKKKKKKKKRKKEKKRKTKTNGTVRINFHFKNVGTE